jgi:homoserine kinase
MEIVRERVSLEVPATSANIGLGFDVWSLALENPKLKVTCEVIDEKGEHIEVVNKGRNAHLITNDESLHSGSIAAKHIMDFLNIKASLRLKFEELGDFPPAKGLGRSAAEAVGACLTTYLCFKKRIDINREQVIYHSGFGEAGASKYEPGHLDNVSAAVNGSFNIIVRTPLNELKVYKIYVPKNLGIAICKSPFEKKGGTERMRRVINYPVYPKEYINSIGRISAASYCLARGDLDGFLEMIWFDTFHEKRRADVLGYGYFDSQELFFLKRYLFKNYGFVINASGAGPNFLMLYNKEKGSFEEAKKYVEDWFKKHNLNVNVIESSISVEGAYDKALKI